MDRINRLGALQRAMMGSFGGDAPPSYVAMPRVSAAPSAGHAIAALRRALAAERAARVEAEARLARVLAEVTSQVRNARGARPDPIVPERRRLVSRIVSAEPEEATEVEGEGTSDPEIDVTPRKIDWSAITDNEEESEDDDG